MKEPFSPIGRYRRVRIRHVMVAAAAPYEARPVHAPELLLPQAIRTGDAFTCGTVQAGTRQLWSRPACGQFEQGSIAIS
jgi:hypothetical protein